MSSLSIQLPRLSGLMSKSKLAHRLVSQSSDTDLSDFKDLHSVLQTHGIDPKTVNTERDAISALLLIIKTKTAEPNIEPTVDLILDEQKVETARTDILSYLKTAQSFLVMNTYGNERVWSQLTAEQKKAYSVELIDWCVERNITPSHLWYTKG